jgi:hypothetical protein
VSHFQHNSISASEDFWYAVSTCSRREKFATAILGNIVGRTLHEEIENTLIGCELESRLIVSIELLQRSLAVSVYSFHVEPVDDSRGVAA